MVGTHTACLCTVISSRSRNQNQVTKTHYRAWMSSWISGCLWIMQSSITMTEFGAGKGCIKSSNRLINFVNVCVQKDPSTTLQCKMPSRSEIEGRTEKLCSGQQQSTDITNDELTVDHVRRMLYAVPWCPELTRQDHDGSCGDPKNSRQRRPAAPRHTFLS